jgi:NAD(P)H-flavin reductase
VFDQAEQQLGIKTIYTVTDTRTQPAAWCGRVGHISPQLIMDEVPDYLNCVFYISGPPSMVDSFKQLLLQLPDQAVFVSGTGRPYQIDPAARAVGSEPAAG